MSTKPGQLLVCLAVLLWVNATPLAAEPTGTGEDAARRRPPWGEGPPPWIKDGQVDEAARKAFFAKRAEERAQAEAAGRPGPALRPAEHAAQEQRRPAGPRPQASAVAGAPGAAGNAPRAGGAGRDGVLWLTDAPPRRDGKGGGRPGGGKPHAGGGMGGMAEAGKDGVPMKRVWLRAGGNPQSARPASGDEAALLQTPDGKRTELRVEPHGGPYNVSFPMPEQGYYNVYLMRRALEQDTLNVTLAKAEVTRGGMAHGLSSEQMAQAVLPRLEAGVPVEIVRERKDKEALSTRINYGDEIAFRILRGGKPVQNARVTFTSGQGWSNSVQSDEEGRAAFTVIRDYYPDDWNLFDKRHRETWLVAASFTAPEAGEHQGGHYAATRYTASLSGAYYPGMADYESYSSGLMMGTVGLLFTGSSVWLYRRRRVKPYREVRFDE